MDGINEYILLRNEDGIDEYNGKWIFYHDKNKLLDRIIEALRVCRRVTSIDMITIISNTQGIDCDYKEAWLKIVNIAKSLASRVDLVVLYLL